MHGSLSNVWLACCAHHQNHLALEELGYILMLGLCCCLAWRLSGYVVCKQRGTMVQKDLKIK